MEQNKEKQSQSKSKGKKQTRQTREQRRQLEIILVGILILIVIIVIAVLVIHRRTYHNYSVLSSSKNENVQAYGFVQFEDEILKYGTDGVSLVNQKEETVWSEDFQMTNPTVDVCENMAVVADKDATSLYILSKEKVVGTVQTSKPILKARVARTGVVAAILQDNDKTWVDFYAKDGSLIAENQTRIDSPGYPVDIAVSPNGKIIMVSYLYVEDAQTTSYVAFYNFGDSGQSEIDNIVSGYTYKDVIVPQTIYLKDGSALAFRDNGFSVYQGENIPKEKKNVEMTSEIVSTFYNDNYAGVVFKDKNNNKNYVMRVYSLNGKMKFEKKFNIEYTQIKISNEMIIMNNDTQVCMIDLNGNKKFDGNFGEGTIQGIFRIASSRYMVVSESGIKTIKLK